ncbi:MAG: tetratricopeptide repeat protein [Gemmatimonadota bacterium]|nr:tetratricopeptide repeat protein [Gemmatimonadota bacterium]
MNKYWHSMFVFIALILFVPGMAAALDTDSAAFPVKIIGEPDTLRNRVSGLIRMGFDQLERDEPRLARESFKRALSLGGEDARIYLGIGRCYLHESRRKLGPLALIERVFNKDFLSRAVSSLEKAVALDPDSWEAYYWLGSAYMKKFGRQDLEHSLRHFERAYKLGGDRRQVRLKMARLHNALGDLKHAEEILFEISHTEKNRVDPLVSLELVRLFGRQREYRRIGEYYWRGAGSITEQVEFEAYFNDLVMVATQSEREQFERTPAGSAAAFLRRFWLERDHNMGLEPGMRLAHHYIRLAVADSLYRVPFSRRNPSLSPNVAYFPAQGVPYDDRGIIFIRHGQPNSTVSYLDSEVEPNVTWVYYLPRSDLTLHFVALLGAHEYQLVHTLDAAVRGGRNFLVDEEGNITPRNSQEGIRAVKVRELYGSRLEIDHGLYARLFNRPGDTFTRMEEYEQNYLDIYRATHTESTPPSYRKQLKCFYDLVDFRGPSEGRSVLEFYAGVPGSQITRRQGSRRYNYDLAYSLVLYNSYWSRVERFDRVESFESLIDPHELVDRLVVGLGRVELDPGSYHYFVKIQNGEAVGQYNGDVYVESFDGDSLCSSGIITARDISIAMGDSGKFNRHDLQVHPNPSRVFHPAEKMFAYQEIYNLRPDEQGAVNYRLTYTLTTLKKERSLFGRIGDSFKWMVGAGRDAEQVVLKVERKKQPQAGDLAVPEDVSLDISASHDGLYELSIRVEDLNNSGSTFQRNTRFYVRK